MTEKAIFCWSGGKDSALALHEVKLGGQYEIVSLLTTITRDYDRVSMHGVRMALLEAQAEALRLPLQKVFISAGASDEEYGRQMRLSLEYFQARGASSVIFGDIFLEDLRRYREEKLSQVEMKAVFPLWKRDTLELARSFVTKGFKAITTCVDSKKLDESFVGRVIDRTFLAELPPGIDPCGENGEFHSFVYDGPIFDTAIKIQAGEKVLREGFYFCDILPPAGAPPQSGSDKNACSVELSLKPDA